MQKVNKTEQILQKEYKQITPDDVLQLQAPTPSFLCPLSANIYDIQFLKFKIRDYETGKVFFEIERDPPEEEKIQDFQGGNSSTQDTQANNIAQMENNQDFDEDEFRTVRYHFGPNFFLLKQVGTALTFSVGEKAVKDFRMIERHYFKDKLIHSFDFLFPFCIPTSTNNWESIYTLPELNEDQIKEMINSPWETRSDSFYFVQNSLVMHNKAEYNYSPDFDQDEDDDDEDDT